MKWMVAPSYANATIKAVNEEDKKALIEYSCDRCGGHGYYAIGMHNNQPVLSPYDGGVCYECNGAGKVAKWVKAYTEKEYTSYLKSRERAREKRVMEIQKKLDNAEERRIKKLQELGYDPANPVVYIIAGGNTYSIKDELKAAGCRFDRAIGWYSTKPIEVPVPYTLLPFDFDNIFTWFPGSGGFLIKDNVHEIVTAAIDANLPETESEYIGEEKERLRDLNVTVSAIRTTEGFYGTTFIYTFKYNKNTLIWMTSSCKELEVGDKLLLTGTVKCHKEYKKDKQTYLSRCIIKKGE